MTPTLDEKHKFIHGEQMTAVQSYQQRTGISLEKALDDLLGFSMAFSRRMEEFPPHDTPEQRQRAANLAWKEVVAEDS